MIVPENKRNALQNTTFEHAGYSLRPAGVYTDALDASVISAESAREALQPIFIFIACSRCLALSLSCQRLNSRE